MSTLNEVVVSLYNNATALQSTPTTLAVIAERIRSDEFKDAILQIRAASDKIVASNLKKQLQAFTPSGRFASRNKAGLLQHSGIVSADIDDLDPHAAAGLRDSLRSDSHVAFACISPSGRGVKALLWCDPARPHLESWRACEAFVKSNYGYPIDPATKDVCRLCYMSHDSDAYITSGLVVPIPYPAQTVTATQVASPSPEGLSRDDVRELLRHIPPAPDYDKWLRIASAVWSLLPKHEGSELLQQWSPEQSPGEYAAKYQNRLTTVTLGSLIFFAKETGWHPSPAFKAKMPDSAVIEAENLALWAKLATREFGVGPVPLKPVPRFSLNGVPICTPGNITTISAQAKTGKTAFVAALIAAAIMPQPGRVGGPDCLGASATDPGSRTILHIDTEQSPYDHHRVGVSTLQRAEVVTRPPNFRSFRLAGSGPQELRSALQLLAQQEGENHGLFAVILDGIGDFADDVNDAKECNPLVAVLHDLAILHDCPVIVIIHENPAQKTGKSRGHLGSQLERKSETNIRLKKKGETTIVFADKTRGAPISEKHGPRFAFSAEHGRHLSVPSDGQTAEGGAKLKALRLLAEECLADADCYSRKFKDLRAMIIAARGYSQATAERRISDMVDGSIIKKDVGSIYTLVVVEA